MGFFDRLLRRKTTVHPKEVAYLSADLAMSHLESLSTRLGERPEHQWAGVAAELLRAYFALASLHAAHCIRDVSYLNRYGATMLDALRLFSGDHSQLVRSAFLNEDAVDYCVHLYVHGRPESDDLEAVQQCANLLQLDFKNPVLMLCAYAHVRTMRILDITKDDISFLEAWVLNSRFVRAYKQIFGGVVASL